MVAVIVIIASLVLGARLLGLFQATSCNAIEAGFTDTVTRVLDENVAFGSRNLITLPAPCDAENLYLIDAELIGTIPAPTTGDSVIDAALAAGVRSNIFLVIDGVAQEAGYDERIIIRRAPGEPLATNPILQVHETRGAFSLRTEGYGRRIRLEES